MLPYRLRTPVYGKNNEHLKQSAAGSVLSGGGPIQVAMEQDLTQLQTRYVETLLSNGSPENHISRNDHHAETETAFQIFKQQFAESKVAMFHLLLPKNVSDKEAYSQLIYAACLEIFRSAFPTRIDPTINEVSLEHAAFAIFSLYALYETNPLPRETKTPLELLPMGLQEEENFRALYRRAFLQSIRIDQQHYSLLLQLRELSLARIASCEQDFYKTHFVQQRSGSNSTSWKCNCAIARSALQVLDRLSTKWELCDYTGPVGLEGLAGHADYSPSNAPNPPPSVIESEDPSYSVQDFEFSNDLKTSLQSYHSSIKGIRVPQETFRTATRLRRNLGSFFTAIHKEPWSRVESRLYGTIDNESEGETKSTVDGMRLAEKTSDNVTTRGNDVSLMHVNQEKIPRDDENDTAGLPSFKTIVPSGLNDGTMEDLQQALGFLFQREGPVLVAPTRDEASKHVADDVSSIGIGGISVATGRGRNALQALLSKANLSKGVPARVGAIPKSDKQDLTGNNSAVMFLNADQMLGDDKSDEDDNDSVVSNLSLSDYDEDDARNRDDTSAATSAAGKQALAKLLNQVKKKTATTHTQKPARKRKVTRKKMAGRPPKRAASVASSVGQGEAALGRLLNSFDERVVPKPAARQSLTNTSEAISCASSIGQGQDALDTLLTGASRTTKTSASTTPRAKNNKTNKRRRNANVKSTELQKAANLKDTDDVVSLASSVGQGRGALGTLLAQAGSRTQESSNADAMSLASSVGQGQGALDALLAGVGSSTKKSGKGSGTEFDAMEE
jgi:hypothetical protein